MSTNGRQAVDPDRSLSRFVSEVHLLAGLSVRFTTTFLEFSARVLVTDGICLQNYRRARYFSICRAGPATCTSIAVALSSMPTVNRASRNAKTLKLHSELVSRAKARRSSPPLAIPHNSNSLRLHQLQRLRLRPNSLRCLSESYTSAT
jgi:hypothetical protein